jgi:hypothetical protein
VYPEGLNATASDEETNTSFAPSPNYAALAEAATGSDGESDGEQWMKGVRVRTVGELKAALQQAESRVQGQGKGMFIEVLI